MNVKYNNFFERIFSIKKEDKTQEHYSIRKTRTYVTLLGGVKITISRIRKNKKDEI